MAATVASVAPALRQAGFRKRRHSFNRTVRDGLVHVLNFQMGSFNPPGTVAIPGLRPDLYGKFTVNLGVYVPLMRYAEPAKSGWINEYNCQLRKRLGELLPEQSDLWWDLGHPEASSDVARAIGENALVWLDRFASHDDILRIFEEEGRIAAGMHPAAPLDIADVYLALGKHIEARKILMRYVAEDHAPGHSAYVAKFVEDRGFPDLIARLRSTD